MAKCLFFLMSGLNIFHVLSHPDKPCCPTSYLQQIKNDKQDPPAHVPELEVEELEEGEEVLLLFRQERAAVMREHSSALEPSFLMVSCT